MEKGVGKKVQIAFSSLGTEVSIQMVLAGKEKLEQSGRYFQNIENIYAKAMVIFSRFDPKSELSALNANLGQTMPCSPWMIEAAKNSIEYNRKTNGLFDPRIIAALENAGYKQDFKSTDFSKVTAPVADPQALKKNTLLEDDLVFGDQSIMLKNRMDFAGIVKGFVTDEVAKYLRSEGVEDFLVDSGGDIFVSGDDDHGDLWNIGVEGIAEEKIILHLSDASVATSGISRRKWEVGGKRMHHIINPLAPEKFAFDLKSVTAVSASVQDADVWAKVLFLMGLKERKEFAEKNKLKCIFLGYSGAAWVSSAIKENILK
jgi:thiamine biosynthesis lipoprotein